MAFKDSDNVARLKTLQSKFEKLRDMKIRTEADVERATADHEEAKKKAIEIAGTDNEDEIREQIRANYEENTKAVDEFEATINEIEKQLSEIGNAE